MNAGNWKTIVITWAPNVNSVMISEKKLKTHAAESHIGFFTNVSDVYVDKSCQK